MQTVILVRKNINLTNLAEFSTHNLFGWRWIANQPLGWSILILYILFQCIKRRAPPAVNKQYALDHKTGFQ